MPSSFTLRPKLWRTKQNMNKKCKKKLKHLPPTASSTLLKYMLKLRHSKKKLKSIKSNKPKKHHKMNSY